MLYYARALEFDWNVFMWQVKICLLFDRNNYDQITFIAFDIWT